MSQTVGVNTGFNDRTGACRFEKLSELLEDQKKILIRVVREIREIADVEAQLEADSNVASAGAGTRGITFGQRGAPKRRDAYVAGASVRHPSHIFLIDGPRGSGKTSLTLTIMNFLEHMGRGRNIPDNLFAGFREIAEGAGAEGPGGVSLAGDEATVLTSPHCLSGYPDRRSCVVLPLICPEDMEVEQHVMEAIMAHMFDMLETLVKEGRHDSEALENLFELRSAVAKGWYLSRKIGVEAILADSINLSDFVRRQTDELKSSHLRMESWRNFVFDFLDLFHSQLLVVAIDDTDTSSANTMDILSAMRMYLDHPRIVTLFAGNLHTLRHTAVVEAYRSLGGAIRPVRSMDSLTAVRWRDFERNEVEEFLEKILPRQYRNFIGQHNTDFKQIFGQEFNEFCNQQLLARLTAFLKTKTAIQLESLENDELRHAANYMALWLLQNYYRLSLLPKTARHLNQFKQQLPDITGDELQSRDDGEQFNLDKKPASRRRVEVVMFYSPDNYQVIQRFRDRDNDAIRWLWQQPELTSEWRGARYIGIKALRIWEGSYSFDYLLYRLDLEMSLPFERNLRIIIPKTLLPTPSGRPVWTPEIWESEDRTDISEKLSETGFKLKDTTLRLAQNRIGISQLFDSPIIPSNCAYFKDIRALPDIAWQPAKDDSASRRWPVFPIMSTGELFEVSRFDPRWEYFRQVVLLFASVPIIPAMPSTEFSGKNYPNKLYAMEKNPVFQLNLSEDPYGNTGLELKPDAAKKLFGNPRQCFPNMRMLVTQQIRTCIRSGLSEHPDEREAGFIYDCFSSDALARAAEREDIVKFAEMTESVSDQRKAENACRVFLRSAVTRYHRLLNDTRNAWHATRIFEKDLNDQSLDSSEGSEFVHSQNDRYQLVGISEINNLLGWSTIFSPENPSEEWAKLSGETSNHTAYYDLFNNEKFTARIANTPQYAQIELINNTMKAFSGLCRGVSEGEEPKSWLNDAGQLTGRIADRCQFDEQEKLQGYLYEFLNINKSEGSATAKTMRSIFLLIHALGPTLSSLIHIDLMGRLWRLDHAATESRNDFIYDVEATAIAWYHFLQVAQIFTVLLGRSMDNIIESDGAGDTVQATQFTICPDISIESSGIHHEKNNNKEEKGENGHYRGMINDIFLRYEVAEIYLRDWYETVWVDFVKEDAEKHTE